MSRDSKTDFQKAADYADEVWGDIRDAIGDCLYAHGFKQEQTKTLPGRLLRLPGVALPILTTMVEVHLRKEEAKDE
jgi:hypothetical protein